MNPDPDSSNPNPQEPAEHDKQSPTPSKTFEPNHFFSGQQPGTPSQPQPSVPNPYESVVVGGPAAGSSKKKKFLLFGGLTLALLLLAGAGVVFGYYLPNKPENVWNTSMTRSGEALDKVVLSATEQKKIEAFKKSDIGAQITYTASDKTYNGTFNLKFDATKADGGAEFTVKQPGQPDQTSGVKLLSELKDGSAYPTLYFQVYGLKALGGDNLELFYPGISEYDGKWITIDEEYLKSMSSSLQPGATEPAPEKKAERITSVDIAEFAQTLSSTTKEYLLTADPAKAVFERRSFVGKESVDGLKTYHYKVGIHKQHAKDFCKAITERIAASKLYKKSPGYNAQKVNEQKEIEIKRCQESVDDNVKKDNTFDLWVDSRYKLIYKVRVVDEENKEAYTEIGQKYKGGDDLSMFLNFHDGESLSDTTFTLDTNLKNSTTSAKLNSKGTQPDAAFDLQITFQAKPLASEIKVEKPAGAVPIQEMIQKLGGDPAQPLSLFGGGPVVDDTAPAETEILIEN